MRTEWIVRFHYGSVVPWMRRHDDGALHAVAGPDRLVLRTPVDLQPRGLTHVAEFGIAAGETIPFILSHAPSYQLPPVFTIDPHVALEQTEMAWQAWTARRHTAGAWTDIVHRSLITLRALIFQPSGGMVAAPTTSLPEVRGGTRNWDYRFCWLRDATFTLTALMNGGCRDEARKWRTWLLYAVGGDPAKIQVLYGVGGERQMAELDLPWLAGFGGAKPVRIGNAAAGQLQLDIYGEVLDALYQARRHGLVDDTEDWMVQRALLEHLETIWMEPDESIWEVRGGPRHFTYSKVMVWVAFDRAVRSVEEFGLEGPVDHWRRLRDSIHAEICARAWNGRIGAFAQSYGSDALDASLLLMAPFGFLPPADPRLRGTVEAIARELIQDGFVLRYRSERQVDGLPAGDNPFLACSFWLVDNLLLLGREEEARALFARLLSTGNDLGLFAEEYDPANRCLAGNFPQGFSHIALVNTAYKLARLVSPDNAANIPATGTGDAC